jgi:hypothetical protein
MPTTIIIGEGAGTNGANGGFTNGEENIGENTGGERTTRTTTMIMINC